MNRRAYVSVNLAALSHNLGRVKHFAPKSKIMAIVKANAYGHGAIQVAKALSDADALGVATVGEALELREAHIEKPLVVLEGFLTPTELMSASQHHFLLFIHHASQIDILEKTALPFPVSVWIKVDTGMNRLGFAPHEVTIALTRLTNCAQIKNLMGFATHFASADESASPQTQIQLQAFQPFSTLLQGGEHTLANSAGILIWPESHAAWVRPGIMLYGISPLVERTGTEFGLKSVMSFYSTLIAIQDIAPGEKVGYGGTWQAEHFTRIGVVACGYADGYPRHARSGTPVLVGKTQVPTVGRISMDMITVDLTHCSEATIGTSVELWGEKLSVQEIARCANTIPYELLCRMSCLSTQ